MLLVACSSTATKQTQLIKKEFIFQTIPDELLSIPHLYRPYAKDERDIEQAYITLHEHYMFLRQNIEAIAFINSKNKKLQNQSFIEESK